MRTDPDVSFDLHVSPATNEAKERFLGSLEGGPLMGNPQDEAEEREEDLMLSVEDNDFDELWSFSGTGLADRFSVDDTPSDIAGAIEIGETDTVDSEEKVRSQWTEEEVPSLRSEEDNIEESLNLECPECAGALVLQRRHLGVKGACVWCQTPIVAAASGEDGSVRIFALLGMEPAARLVDHTAAASTLPSNQEDEKEVQLDLNLEKRPEDAPLFVEQEIENAEPAAPSSLFAEHDSEEGAPMDRPPLFTEQDSQDAALEAHPSLFADAPSHLPFDFLGVHSASQDESLDAIPTDFSPPSTQFAGFAAPCAAELLEESHNDQDDSCVEAGKEVSLFQDIVEGQKSEAPAFDVSSEFSSDFPFGFSSKVSDEPEENSNEALSASEEVSDDGINPLEDTVAVVGQPEHEEEEPPLSEDQFFTPVPWGPSTPTPSPQSGDTEKRSPENVPIALTAGFEPRFEKDSPRAVEVPEEAQETSESPSWEAFFGNSTEISPSRSEAPDLSSSENEKSVESDFAKGFQMAFSTGSAPDVEPTELFSSSLVAEGTAPSLDLDPIFSSEPKDEFSTASADRESDIISWMSSPPSPKSEETQQGKIPFVSWTLDPDEGTPSNLADMGKDLIAKTVKPGVDQSGKPIISKSEMDFSGFFEGSSNPVESDSTKTTDGGHHAPKETTAVATNIEEKSDTKSGTPPPVPSPVESTAEEKAKMPTVSSFGFSQSSSEAAPKKKVRKGFLILMFVILGFSVGAALSTFILPVDRYVDGVRDFLEAKLTPTAAVPVMPQMPPLPSETDTKP